MTSNNTLKQKAREHARKTGVSYTQARREVLAQYEGAAAEPALVRWVQIQQAVRGDGSTPLPFLFDPNGYVSNQDFWRGDPWRLIGFVADPDGIKVIDLQREEFLAEPERAVGMHPVLMDRGRHWSTWKGAVERIDSREHQAIDPDVVRAEFYLRTPAGEWTATMGVAHVLHCLPQNTMRGGGKFDAKDGDDLLAALCMTGDDKALDFSTPMDDVEDEDLTLEVRLVGTGDEARAAVRKARR